MRVLVGCLLVASASCLSGDKNAGGECYFSTTVLHRVEATAHAQYGRYLTEKELMDKGLIPRDYPHHSVVVGLGGTTYAAVVADQRCGEVGQVSRWDPQRPGPPALSVWGRTALIVG